MTSLNCELLRTRVLKQVFDEENIPIQIEISNDPGRFVSRKSHLKFEPIF
jgi:hypothetical protein